MSDTAQKAYRPDPDEPYSDLADIARTAEDVLAQVLFDGGGPVTSPKVEREAVESGLSALHADLKTELDRLRPRPLLKTDSDALAHNYQGQNDAIDLAERVLDTYFGRDKS